MRREWSSGVVWLIVSYWLRNASTTCAGELQAGKGGSILRGVWVLVCMCFLMFHIAFGLGLGVSGDVVSSCHLSKVVSQSAELSLAWACVRAVCACVCCVVAMCTAFWCKFVGLIRNCFCASERLCDVVFVEVV